MSDDNFNQPSQEPAGWIFEHNLSADSLFQEITDKVVISKQEESIEESGISEPWQEAVEQQATQPVSVTNEMTDIDSNTDIPASISENIIEPQTEPKKQFLGMSPFEKFVFFLLVILFLVIAGLLFLFITGNLSLPFLAGIT